MNVSPSPSNYPRDPMSGGLAPAPNFNHISTAFNIVTKNMGVFVGGTFVLCLIFAALYAVMLIPLLGMAMSSNSPDPTASTAFGGAFLVVYVLFIAAFYGVFGGFIAGMAACGIEAADTGTTSFTTLKSGFSKFGVTFVVGMIVGILVYVGSMLCIIPGLVVSGLLMFSAVLPHFEGTGVGESLSRSVEMTKSNVVGYSALYFVVSLVASIGAILCGVGLLFTLPVLPIVVGLHYRDFRNSRMPQTGFVPPQTEL